MSYQYYNPQHDINYRSPQNPEEQKQSAANSEQGEQSQNQATSAEPKQTHQINISQILVDFRNTIASIGAPAEIEQQVNEYVAMVETESQQESPRQASIVTNLKTASKMLDDYISSTLNKPSNVVQDWIDAFLLQEVDYKADAQKAEIPASKQIEEQIEKTNPELKSQFQTEPQIAAPVQTSVGTNAAAQYNQYQQNINYHKKTTASSAQKSIEQNELAQQKDIEKTDKPKKKAKKFVRPDGKIYQDGKVVGEKTEDGKIIKHSKEEIAKETQEPPKEQKLEVVTVPKESAKIQTSRKEPKERPVSKDITVQQFYAKSQEYLKSGDAQKALESYRKTLSYAKKAKDRRAQAQIIQGMGESYNKMNNLAKATKAFYKASKRTKDVSIRAVSHDGMGQIYDEVGKFDLAMDHYFESLSLNGEGDSPTRQAKTLNKIGAMHADKYMSKEAIDFYKLALTMAKQKQPDMEVMSESLGNAATAFKDLGKPKSAMKYYQKAIVIEQRVDNKEATSKTYEKAADLMLDMKKPNKAKNLYKKAVQEALLNKDSAQVKSLQQKMSLIKAS